MFQSIYLLAEPNAQKIHFAECMNNVTLQKLCNNYE